VCEAMDTNWFLDLEALQTLDLICPICHEVLMKPWIILSKDYQCQHVFCAACIDAYRKTNKTCPVCRSNIHQMHADLRSQRMLAEQMVKCKNSHLGCKATGKLGIQGKDDFFQVHEAKCGYRSILCDCKQVYLVQDADDHLAKCAVKGPIPCMFRAIGCDVKLPTYEMRQHEATCDRDHLILAMKSCVVQDLSLLPLVERLEVEIIEDFSFDWKIGEKVSTLSGEKWFDCVITHANPLSKEIRVRYIEWYSQSNFQIYLTCSQG
jgi:hypothetical protein